MYSHDTNNTMRNFYCNNSTIPHYTDIPSGASVYIAIKV